MLKYNFPLFAVGPIILRKPASNLGSDCLELHLGHVLYMCFGTEYIFNAQDMCHLFHREIIRVIAFEIYRCIIMNNKEKNCEVLEWFKVICSDVIGQVTD
jgi:hypothetical protein